MLYLLWAVVAIGLALCQPGHGADHATRLALIAFLLLQLAALPYLRRPLSRLRPRSRFVLSGILLAAVCEGFYMFTKPAFACLRIGADTDLLTGVRYYLVDLGLTLPAYVIIFLVIWNRLNTYRYSPLEYAVVMAMGQAMGDGCIFFLSAPLMLAFLPYQMVNYHAMNLLPYLTVRDELPPLPRSWRRFLALPLLVAVYVLCGGVIAKVGPLMGLR